MYFIKYPPPLIFLLFIFSHFTSIASDFCSNPKVNRPVKTTIINEKKISIEILSADEECNLTPFTTIRKKETINIDSFKGNVFVFKNPKTGKIVADYQVSPKSSIFTIEPFKDEVTPSRPSILAPTPTSIPTPSAPPPPPPPVFKLPIKGLNYFTGITVIQDGFQIRSRPSWVSQNSDLENSSKRKKGEESVKKCHKYILEFFENELKKDYPKLFKQFTETGLTYTLYTTLDHRNYESDEYGDLFVPRSLGYASSNEIFMYVGDGSNPSGCKSDGFHSTLYHEMGHSANIQAPDSLLTNSEIEASYNKAMQEGKWKETYAASNFREYWAEGFAIWNGVGKDTDIYPKDRSKLKRYDETLYRLLERFFNYYD